MRLAIDPARTLIAGLLWTGSLPLAGAACTQPVYLTFDTGHMGVAPLIAEVLQRQQVKVTFFAAHEKTREGDGTLGQHWAPWWQARAAEGHAFASHTWSHAYWRADVQEAGVQKFRIRPSAGAQAGQNLLWSAQDYCNNLIQAAQRLQALTGQAPLPLFRAPGAKRRPVCLKRPGNAALPMWGGPLRVFWATSCPVTPTPTRSCCNKPCNASAQGTS